MRRREFLQGTAAGLASLAAGGYHLSYGQESKPKRVALIGCGWYGKCDLLRLLQVEPVDVVALCDVDKNMLNEAGDIVATRQKSRLFSSEATKPVSGSSSTLVHLLSSADS